jgi:ribosomal protein S17
MGAERKDRMLKPVVCSKTRDKTAVLNLERRKVEVSLPAS